MVPATQAETAQWLSEFVAGTRDGKKVSSEERLRIFSKIVGEGRIQTVEHMLPLLLNLKGKPYTLDEFFPFSPLFRLRKASSLVIKAARQTSKSTSLGSEGILFANCVPHTSTLYVTPLYEQIRKFSGNVVGDFINNSPVKALWSDTTTNNSVLQRSFVNNSKMVFSFALLSVNRIRGNQADRVNVDEFQDFDRDHVPIVQACMDQSPWAIFQATGTPKTMDGPLEAYWQRSSQAEWIIPCTHCTENGRPTDNVPSIDYHLDAMIGEYRDDISERYPGVVCHACGGVIYPQMGRWRHRYKERRWDCAGYHVPQILMPWHYASPKRWAKLLAKREFMAPATFYNECLGESYDLGSKMVSLAELQAACTLPIVNNPKYPSKAVKERLQHYSRVVLGVDWGGGRRVMGKEEMSFTTLALVGMTGSGKLEVVWGQRLLTPHDHVGEAMRVLAILRLFSPHLLAYDYTGAGDLRETVLVQSGMPQDHIVRCHYLGAIKGPMVKFVPVSKVNPRHHYQVDKSRTIQCLTGAIKLGCVSFFQYDWHSDDNPGVLRDFLALVDQKVETSAGEIYKVGRQEGFPDDFAHAVNMAASAIWHSTGQYPDFAEMTGGRSIISQAQLAAMVGFPEDDSGGWG